MNAECSFEARLAHARERLAGLAGEVASLPPKQKTLLKGLLDELSAGAAELGAAVEELRDRNEALAAARREADEGRAAALTATVEELRKEISGSQRAREALRESEERFNLFMKHLPGAAYVKDADGRILFTNDHVGNLLGVDPGSLVGKTDWDLWPKEVAAKMREDEEWVLATGRVRETIDVFVTPSGPVQYLTYKFPLPQQHSRPLVAGASVDITERIRMEEALRESEERYRGLVELSPDAIVVAVDGKVVFANAACAHALAAARPEDLYGAHVRDFVHPDMRQLARRRLDQVLQNRRRMPMTELTLVRADGATVDVEAASSPISYVERPAVQFVFHDITQRKQSEARIREYREQLRSLASEVTLSEERERRRVAQILHDNISQVLAVSKMMLAEALKAEPREESDKRMREVSGLLEDSIRYARTLTLDLSNPTLYVLGLEAALDGLAKKVGETHKIAVSFRDDGAAKPISEDIRVLLYQCARELLMNIVKHAHAKNVVVSTRRDGATIRVWVEDDGVGFDVPEMWEQLTKGGGIGLFSIRERLGHFGGRLDVKSQPGKGAAVTMTAPLALDEPDAVGGA